jgi:hypothetical protein
LLEDKQRTIRRNEAEILNYQADLAVDPKIHFDQREAVFPEDAGDANFKSWKRPPTIYCDESHGTNLKRKRKRKRKPKSRKNKTKLSTGSTNIGVVSDKKDDEKEEEEEKEEKEGEERKECEELEEEYAEEIDVGKGIAYFRQIASKYRC